MYKDMFGKTRVKLGLHQHTTRSDGRLTPEKLSALYRDQGYDAIALTDHWCFGAEDTIEGLPILSGAEYHVGARDAGAGVYHILCLLAEREPKLQQRDVTAQGIIDAIHEAGGIAVLAHPAWSMNTSENVKALHGIDAVEIYNTVSENMRRADASILVDHYALNGQVFLLFAADDYHGPSYFDTPTSFLMVESEDLNPANLKKAIREKRFYASTGPEIHLSRKGETVVVDCSPVCEVVFASNLVHSPNCVIKGEGLTHATYTLLPEERFIRAFVTDKEGRRAWSNFIEI